MSAALSSGNKQSVYSEENEVLYDPYPNVLLGSLCPEPPWPEWSDAELNAELWEEGKATTMSTRSSFKVSIPSIFEDPELPNLPPGISDFIYSWKRPEDVFQEEGSNVPLTVYDPDNANYSLHIPSELATGCEFFKTFIEEISILQFYALKYGFQAELESPAFISTTQGETWRPWHHVYALCKAGKGVVHKPLYNPSGKYIVRLYYLGAWRRFVVDDRIPCDIEGNSLLPLTQVIGELWPIILVKALLKILSLTPTNNFAAADFPLLCSFTGWTPGCFYASNKSNDQVWDRLLCLSPRYKKQVSDTEIDMLTTSPLRNSALKDPVEESGKDLDMPDPEKFCFLLAKLNSTDSSVNCSVAITMVRDRPLARATRREKTKPWKRIRWINWAKEKGFWINDNLPPYRRLQLITYNPEVRRLLYSDAKPEQSREIPKGEDMLSKTDTDIDAPEQWCDYLRFLDYAHYINVLFKPSFFVGIFKISCLRPKALEMPTVQAVKGTPKGKVQLRVSAAAPQNLFIFPYVVKNSFNEPIFLLCEGHSGIFLSISLWVCPMKAKTGIGYLDPEQPKVLKIGRASLVVEMHDWRSYEQGEIIGMVKTVGNSSIPLNLKPGRYLLKLWLCTDSPYVIDVYSNATIFANKSQRIRFLMSSEPQRILDYIADVSNAFLAVTLKFGKPDLPKALRNFYDSIKPGNDYSIGYLRKIDDFIETFLTCILLLLKDLISNSEEIWGMMCAMRSLFINPKIRCDTDLKEPSPELSEDEINPIYTDAEVEKATIIQKYFRGYRVRLLWKCQTPARKEFKTFSERLKKICDIIFVPGKRDIEVGKLLRKIVMTKPNLHNTFRFHEDFANVLQLEEFTGKISNVEPFAWVPLTRFIIGCHSEGLVPCYFFLSCNLERVVIQGFNNDTGEEIFRLANTISPHYYHTNLRGYTIFAFGWNEANFKTVNWKLEVVKMKHYPAIHLCNLLMSSTCKPYAMPSLEVLEIRNVYVPNSKSRICRCFIKIQKRCLLTLRLSLSYSRVRFLLIISLGRGYSTESVKSDYTSEKVVLKVISKNGAVTVPALVLECVENIWWENAPDGASTVYKVEAFVINNSWPLTKQEWGLVEPLRLNGESLNDASLASLLSRKGRPESRRKIGRISKKSLQEQKVVENPLWVLQVVNETPGPESAEPIVMEEDRSHAEAVKAMKASWREKDPERGKKGREMRMNFLYKIYLEERKNALYGEDSEKGEVEGEVDDPQMVLDRLSNFSYLINDTSPTRYTYSPRLLPATPLIKLLCKYKNPTQTCDLRPPTSADDQTEVSFKLSRHMVDEIEEDRKDFSRQCSHYRSVLMNHMMEEQKLSNRLMEQAHEERLKAIETLER